VKDVLSTSVPFLWNWNTGVAVDPLPHPFEASLSIVERE
jgi:hypothetical protein